MDASKRNDDETFEKFRHFSLIGPKWMSYTKVKEVSKATRLRTFLPMSMSTWSVHGISNYNFVETICKLRFLRVLSVTDLNVDVGDFIIVNRYMKRVPQSIGGLEHLRYLNFSYTEISYLPEQVGDLYNLQSLLLQGCVLLSRLPKSFAKLTKLRHFDISCTPRLKKMPLGIGGLTSLQTLPKVIISRANINHGFKISDLSELQDIQSGLSIMGLDKVKSPLQAKDANLPERKHLVFLEMEWSDEFDGSRNEMIEYQVLEHLRPHHYKLRNLNISFNMGMRFPGWVGDPSYDQLTKLTLSGCKSTQLPTLGDLPALKELLVTRVDEVENVGFEFIATAPSSNSFGDNIAFPSLEVLKFGSMPGWQRWSTTDDNGIGRSFPRLRELSIEDCPKLTQVSVGSITLLRVLHIQQSPEAVLRSIVGVCSSLAKLKMEDVRGLTRLHGDDLMHLRALEHLCISRCDDLRYLWEAQSDACNTLSSLVTLEVTFCKNLVSLGEKEANFMLSMESLKEMVFRDCGMLESFSCPNSVEKLVIDRCDSLASFTLLTTTRILQEPSSSLTESIIGQCDNILVQRLGPSEFAYPLGPQFPDSLVLIVDGKTFRSRNV